MYELLSQLNTDGLINYKKYKEPQMSICCPFHGGGNERKPSCGFVTSLDNTVNLPLGFMHCFVCKDSRHRSLAMPFLQMLGCILNNRDPNTPREIAEALAINYLSKYNLDRSVLQAFVGTGLHRKRPSSTKIAEFIQTYDWQTPYEQGRSEEARQYLYSRGISDYVIDKFKLGYDPEYNVGDLTYRTITFPVFNSNGVCIFLPRRSIDSKIFFLPDDVPKPVYGMEHCIDSEEIWVCESAFNAHTCWQNNKSAVALFGSSASATQLKTLLDEPKNLKRYILALDPDDAGFSGTKSLSVALRDQYQVRVASYPFKTGQDLNNLDSIEFSKILIKRSC